MSAFIGDGERGTQEIVIGAVHGAIAAHHDAAAILPFDAVAPLPNAVSFLRERVL